MTSSIATSKPDKACTGAAEWAQTRINIATGCSHDCRYCYAKWDACQRWKRLPASAWPEMKVREQAVEKLYPKYPGLVMFPSTHDITPRLLGDALVTLVKLLEAGNDVLVVSKPHFNCIDVISGACMQYKSRLLFRFSITADDPDLLGYWEPGAPTYEERVKCLEFAHAQGYQTSVSMEPMLDVASVSRLVGRLGPFVTETIWIGKMNSIRNRVRVETAEDQARVDAIVTGQSDDAIKALYHDLKDDQKVRWKDSIKDVIGLPKPKAGG